MQKTFHDENFVRHINHGERSQYYQAGHHERIIDNDIFDKAQLAIQHRSVNKGGSQTRSSPKKKAGEKAYPLSGILLCSCCKGLFCRKIKYRKKESYAVWVCSTHLRDKEKCAGQQILEEDIYAAFLTLLNKLAFSKDFLLLPYYESLKEEDRKGEKVSVMYVEEKLMLLGNDMRELRMQYGRGAVDSQTYHRRMAVITRIQSELLSRKNKAVRRSKLTEKTKELLLYLKGRKISSGPFEEEIFESTVQSVKADERHRLTFVLKCGLVLTEDLLIRQDIHGEK